MKTLILSLGIVLVSSITTVIYARTQKNNNKPSNKGANENLENKKNKDYWDLSGGLLGI